MLNKFKQKQNLVFIFGILALVVLFAQQAASHAAPGDIVRVSVASNGSESDDRSTSSFISADGRYVAFRSLATNLVSGITNGREDCFIHDTQSGVTSRISVDSNGVEADGNSDWPVVSDDGRYVAFESYATNLVSDDTNDTSDVFVHDRQTGETSRVSVDSNGRQGNGASQSPSMSADGRYIAFDSRASNLIADDTNDEYDIFVHDQQTGETIRVSVASDGTEADSYSREVSLSANGRYATFRSDATNLIIDDNNARDDIFIHDIQTGTTSRISVASSGTEGDGNSYDPTISANGRFVAYHSSASTLVSNDGNGSTDDVFLHDIQTNTTNLISVSSNGAAGNEDSLLASISDDGRYVTFESTASTLVNEPTNGLDNIYVHDTLLGTTTLVSITLTGTGASSASATISADGKFIAFGSNAANLIVADTNNEADIFVSEQAVSDLDQAVYLPLVTSD